jgi:hypothetical protein
MKSLFVAAGLLAFFASTGAAQPPAPPPQAPLPKGQMPVLGRPTESTDEVPVFNFDDYFPGTWDFEWNVPDSPVGPAGPISGTTVYTKLDANTYEAQTKAEGPLGSFTVKERLVYDKAAKTITKQVTDSRGFSYSSKATVAGDLGGIYNILFTSDPFLAQGQKVQIKEALRTMSPFNYRVATTLSVDGGPFANLGNPWWRKQTKQ